MNKFRLNRLTPLTGLAAIALLIMTLTKIGMNDYLPSNEKITAFLDDHVGQMGIWVYVGLLASFLMVWFAGGLSSDLEKGNSNIGHLTRIAFGGGLATGIVMAIIFAIASAAFDRASVAGGGISPEGATTLYDLQSSLAGTALPLSLALFAGAVGVSIIQSNRFPLWFGWFGVLAALTSLSPIGYLGQVVPMIWLAIASVWLFIQGLSV